MPFRFYRRVPIIPGVRLNLSKRGASVSLGGPGAHVTFGRQGVRQTVGIPGTGVYYTHLDRPGQPSRPAAPAAASGGVIGILEAGHSPIGTVLHVLGFLIYSTLWLALHVGVFLVELAVAVLGVSLMVVVGGRRRRRRW